MKTIEKNEKIEKEFEDIIREQMTDKQFKDWYTGWIDSEEIIDRALNWDIEQKKEALKEFKKMKF
jgi:hypothetical protein